jgi:hypothetical protein
MTHHLLPNDRNNWIKQIQEQQNCKNAVWDILSMQGEYYFGWLSLVQSLILLFYFLY